MTRRPKLLLSLALAALAVVAVVIKWTGVQPWRPAQPLTLVGSVLKQDSDPDKETPLSGVTVTASVDSTVVTAKSAPSGLFTLTLQRSIEKSKPVLLTFKDPAYKTLEITASNPGNQLYIAHLQPLHPQSESSSPAAAKLVQIKNIRVRYTFKDQSTIQVGSVAKQFRAANKGNVPCNGQPPCSPDGRWKATGTNIPLDAGQGNQFHNVRVSCFAGPCAFTEIEPFDAAHLERNLTISVLNWLDATDFLIEADVIRTMVTDEVRDSYPFIVGQTMNFALPPTSEGPSVEANLDTQHIVFPLGPTLILSWADCSLEVSPDRNKIYRCQLKSGYQFQE